MKIHFKTMRKKEIKVGDKVTLIPGYENEKYTHNIVKKDQVYTVYEVRPSSEGNELSIGLMYWQEKKHFKIVE